jgi:hypothetical protein
MRPYIGDVIICASFFFFNKGHSTRAIVRSPGFNPHRISNIVTPKRYLKSDLGKGRNTMRFRLLLGAVLLVCVAGTASALNYLPLGEGTVSYFEGVADPSATLVLTIEENDGMVAVASMIETGGNDFATWFQLSQDVDGQTYLLGQSFDGGATWALTADPVVWIDTPLEVGKTWSQETMLGEDTYVIDCEVTAHEAVTVPAGEYSAYCIVQEAVLAGMYEYTYIGWYAENIGLVSLDWTGAFLGDVYELTDAVVVGYDASSWSQVKSLYR